MIRTLRFEWLWLCVLTFAIWGCAINNYGALAANITKATGAWVIDVYSIGGYLRGRPDDSGITLGWTRRSYIFPERSEELLVPGWHYFAFRWPNERAVAQHTETIGVDLIVTSPERSLALGYKRSTVLARVPAGSNVLMRIHYQPFQPWKTRVEYCEEGDLC